MKNRNLLILLEYWPFIPHFITMAVLKLHFLSYRSPELCRIEFAHPINRDKKLISERGSIAGTKGATTFSWSSGVHALSLFVVHAVRFEMKGDVESACLEGEHGSAAASFDYALSKNPIWLIDMFGTDSNGVPIIRRCIHRKNPERKRPGPVSLFVNRSFLDPTEITLFVEDRQITSETQLTHLANALEQSYLSRSRRPNKKNTPQQLPIAEDPQQSVPTPTLETTLSGKSASSYLMPVEELTTILYQEARQCLPLGTLFHRKALAQRIDVITQNPSVLSITGNSFSLQSEFDAKLSASHRNGSAHEAHLHKYLCQQDPLRIATTVTVAATLAVLTYLKECKGYNIEIDYSYLYTNEITDAIQQHSFIEQPHVCILGLLPAAELISLGSRTEYTSCMLMPHASNKIVAAAAPNVRKLLRGRPLFALPTDKPTSASYFYNELLRSGVLSPECQVTHLEPAEITEALKRDCDETLSILWFPHYQINHFVNNCSFVEDDHAPVGALETVLFAHESLMRERKTALCLDIAIRDAWLQLIHSEELLMFVISKLANCPQYQKVFSRSCGLRGVDNAARQLDPQGDVTDGQTHYGLVN